MIILGVNDAHDASACLMVDGKIVAAAQEERFSGLKGDYGYPKHSIDFCLDFVGIKPEEVDIVTVPSMGWNPVLVKLKRNANFSVNDWVTEQHEFWMYELELNDHWDRWDYFLRKPYFDIYKDRNFKLDEYYPFDHLIHEYQDKYGDQKIIKEAQQIRLKYIRERFPKASVHATLHEDAHTYYSYYGSHLQGERVLALTAEGVGDYSNATVSIFDKHRKELSRMKGHHLGHIFQYITLILGMKPAQHEYKVMGLAPYANKKEVEKSYKVFKDIFKVEGFDVVFDKRPRDLYFHFRDALEGHRFDGIAGALQKFTEEILCKWVESCVKLTGIRKLVCSGGVFQNIKAGKAISELDCVDDISILPAVGDTSTSIGACYYQNSGGEPLEHVYLGPDVSNVEQTMVDKGIFGKYWVENIRSPKLIAQHLAEGKIIARCAGRMEFGHRALGNRSILADPRDPAIVRRINDAIKFRDFWMPFTPSLLGNPSEAETDYYKTSKRLDSRFMCMAFETTEKGKTEFAAAIHPGDFTMRPQSVDRETNRDYWEIIAEFSKLTRVRGLLNTSFNLHGEPIVLGAEEAIRTFEESDLDGLILGNFLIMRRR